MASYSTLIHTKHFPRKLYLSSSKFSSPKCLGRLTSLNLNLNIHISLLYRALVDGPVFRSSDFETTKQPIDHASTPSIKSQANSSYRSHALVSNFPAGTIRQGPGLMKLG